MEKKYILENIKCPSCVKLVEMTLNSEDGVKTAKVNLEDKSLNIEFDSNIISEDKLKEILKDIDHSVVK
ncbi:heavy-metal-associated domain-containing protein [Cetobacterium sp. SF1]|uniref:heavy-metal-associated domain-containing protein n=1 Tax=unclassified Cetobacterium TaxID=2630983 RepID=UPI003CECD964